MARESARYQTFSRRAFLLAGGQGLVLTGLGARLYYLSVVQGEQYRLRAEKNRISLRLIAPQRGEILDRKGRKLATNRQDFRVFLIPEQASDPIGTLRHLGDMVALSDQRMMRIQRRMERQRQFVPVTVAEGLDWETFARINVSIPELPGVLPDSGLSRYYPDGNLVAHLVGYLGSPGEDVIENSPLYQLPGVKVGREGLESRFEDILRGSPGTRRVEVNAVGREIRELPPRRDALRGNDLALTVDLDLQRYAASQLGETAAGAVVLDLERGDLLALASTPAFDPNEFTFGMSEENWNALLQDPRKPLLNKCLSGQFPPGSTIKMIVALAALEQGAISPETEFYCNGKHRLGNHTFHCWKRRGHGRLDLVRGIAQSCDVYFYKLAERIDIDVIADMARRFGFGETHGLALDGEKQGLVPDRAWKQAVMNEPWQGGETLIASIGQGAMLATPLQLAIMTGRIATGRRLKPRIVRPLEDDVFGSYRGGPDFDPMDVNPVHLALMRRSMEMVMERGGTAHDYSRRKSAPKQAGKTGTAQVRRITEQERLQGVLDNSELPWNARDHALFVGYAPAEAPRVAVSILVQHGGGGSKAAAPIGRRLLDRALDILAADDRTALKDEKGDRGDTPPAVDAIAPDMGEA